jgi:hypothetical protein
MKSSDPQSNSAVRHCAKSERKKYSEDYYQTPNGLLTFSLFSFYLFGRYPFDHRRLDLLQNAVSTNNALRLSAPHIQLFRWNPRPALDAFINDATR